MLLRGAWKRTKGPEPKLEQANFYLDIWQNLAKNRGTVLGQVPERWWISTFTLAQPQTTSTSSGGQMLRQDFQDTSPPKFFCESKFEQTNKPSVVHIS